MNTNRQPQLTPVGIDNATGQPWLWRNVDGRFYRLDANQNLIETDNTGRPLQANMMGGQMPQQQPNLTPIKNDAYGNPVAWTDNAGKFYKNDGNGYYEVDQYGRPLQHQQPNNQYTAFNQNTATVGFNSPRNYNNDTAVNDLGFGSSGNANRGSHGVKVPRTYIDELEAFNNNAESVDRPMSEQYERVMTKPELKAESSLLVLSEDEGWVPEETDSPYLYDEEKERLELILNRDAKTFKYIIVNK